MPFDYEIGQLPEGWTRGELIDTLNDNFHAGRTMGLHRAPPSFYEEFSREVVLRFDVTQAGRVLAWLRWWFEDFPNDYLDIERKIR